VPMNKIYSDRFGMMVRKARVSNHYTREALAEKLKISPRHLTAIENEGKTPSFELFTRMILTLGLSADAVFYAEECKPDSDIATCMRLFHLCNPRDRKVVLNIMRTMLQDQDVQDNIV